MHNPSAKGLLMLKNWVVIAGTAGWPSPEYATSAAEDEPSTPERAVGGLTGWIDCFGKARLAGTVFAGGVTSPGEVIGHPSLRQAYEMGKNV